MVVHEPLCFPSYFNNHQVVTITGSGLQKLHATNKSR